jgi:hypothetical protein
LQTALVAGLLLATLLAAEVFAVIGCHCSDIRPSTPELPPQLSPEQVPAGPPDVKVGPPQQSPR